VSQAKLRPSAGFMLLFISYSLLIATFAWGFATPELERVWALIQSMQRSQFTELAPKQVQTLKTALGHYPTLSRAFIGRAPVGFIEPTRDGWVSIPKSHVITSTQVRRALSLDVECQAPASAFPVSVMFERAAVRQSLRFDRAGKQRLVLQVSDPASPEIISVITSSGANRENQAIELRLAVQGPPEPMGSP